MTAYVSSNNAKSTLAGSMSDVDTTLTVQNADKDKFPVVTNAVNHTYVSLELSGVVEHVKVTARSSGSASMTVVRAQGGSSAVAWNVGAVVECRPIGQIFDDKADASALTAHLNDTADAHDASAISYDNGTSGLAATEAQAAIDELASEKLDKAGGTMTGDLTMGAGRKIIFEGTSDDAHELTIDPGNPTADRTQTHQDVSGTVALIAVREVIGCFPAGSMKAQTTNGCAPLTWEESASNKVMTGYLAFDQSTHEYAQFSFRAPNALDETAGFLARFVWKEASGATSHDVVWQVEMQAQGDGDTIDSTWGAAITVTDTGTSGTRRISDATATITPGGTWAAGDEITVRVSRKAADASDNLNADAHLIEVVLLATYASSQEA